MRARLYILASIWLYKIIHLNRAMDRLSFTYITIHPHDIMGARHRSCYVSPILVQAFYRTIFIWYFFITLIWLWTAVFNSLAEYFFTNTNNGKALFDEGQHNNMYTWLSWLLDNNGSLGRHAYFERGISHSGHFWGSVTKRIAVKPLLRALFNDLELLQRGFKYQTCMYTM